MCCSMARAGVRATPGGMARVAYGCGQVPLRPSGPSPPGRGSVGAGRTMPPRSPVAGHRCGSVPPGPQNTYPDTTSAPCEPRRRSRGRSIAARRRHGPRAEAGDRAGPAAAFENGRLKIARGLPLAGALVGELRVFKVRFSAGGRDTYPAFRRARRPGDGGGDGVWFETAGCWRGPPKELPGHQGRAPI